MAYAKQAQLVSQAQQTTSPTNPATDLNPLQVLRKEHEQPLANLTGKNRGHFGSGHLLERGKRCDRL
jgi:hypothetical protein